MGEEVVADRDGGYATWRLLLAEHCILAEEAGRIINPSTKKDANRQEDSDKTKHKPAAEKARGLEIVVMVLLGRRDSLL
jgi:hypothetical protein